MSKKISDELQNFCEPVNKYYDTNSLYLSGKELEVARETDELEMDVLRYMELTDDEEYNKNVQIKKELICNYCIDKIIEMHRGRPIIVNEDGLFINAGYANYYSDIICLAYDADISTIADYINSYYKTKKKKK